MSRTTFLNFFTEIEELKVELSQKESELTTSKKRIQRLREKVEAGKKTIFMS
jgi:hypothetical protein